MKSVYLFVLLLAVAVLEMTAQDGSSHDKALSVWNIHSRDVITLQAEQKNPIAVLTPSQSIVVRRIEAISLRGPINRMTSSEPVPCPLPFSIEITNGSMAKTVPISTAFLNKGSEQTYTDSGLLNLSFAAGTRITVTLTVPGTGFPPTSCVLNGLNISIQFESAEPSRRKAN